MGISLFDLNEIKKDPKIATRASTTFIRFSLDLAKDTNGNAIVAASNGNAAAVRNFVAETIKPKILKFDLDLTAEVLTAYYSETVNISSTIPSKFSLRTPDKSEKHVFLGLAVRGTDSDVVKMQVSNDDLNEIKRI